MSEAAALILANWNGVEMPLSEVRVSVLDRSFLFGDAVYEVLRVYQGVPFLFDEHLQRLQSNLQKMNIITDVPRIGERIRSTLAHSALREATVYIQVTRGEAMRSHLFPDPPPMPNELIYVRAFQDPYARQRVDGGSVLLVDDLRWKRCDLKTVNLLANCLAAEQAHQAGCDEGVFVDADGTLVEGTHTSLFGVRNGSIVTSPLGSGLLPGITRRLVLQMAESEQIPIMEERLHRDRIADIQELFLTGTSTEVLPICQVNRQPVGTGVPGPVVRRLQQAYRKIVASTCTPR